MLKTKEHRNAITHWITIVCLGLALTFQACAKKDDPNISGDSGAQDETASSGNIGEEDLGGGRGGRGGSSGTLPGFSTVYFEYDSASLTSESRKALENGAGKIKSNEKLAVRLEGHCDERGSTEYNLALGERRANSVREYLTNLGVSKKRLKTLSYGEEKPAVDGHSEDAWAKNRRVEFTSMN